MAVEHDESRKNALEMLQIPHDPSTPYRPQTNGVAEHAVRHVNMRKVLATAVIIDIKEHLNIRQHLSFI